MQVIREIIFITKCPLTICVTMVGSAVGAKDGSLLIGCSFVGGGVGCAIRVSEGCAVGETVGKGVLVVIVT